MACATLKRSLDFDPLLHDHHKSPKRQRCAPMTVSPTAAASSSTPTKPSPFGEVKPPMTNVVIAAKIQAELRRMQRRRQIKSQHRCSRHPETNAEEAHATDGTQQDSGSGSDSEAEMVVAASSPPLPSTSSFADSAPAAAATASSTKQDKEDKPIFNFKQVNLICDRLVREREAALREEYDRVLTDKLAEQYDAFVKFTYDQIQRRLHDRPMSYVS